MKKENKIKNKLFNTLEDIRNSKTIVVLFIIAIVALLIVILCIKYFYNNEFINFKYEMLLELAKALLITIIVGLFTKIITDEFVRIQKNDSKMKDIGIYEIGEGKLDHKQKNIMFGNAALGCRMPSELKFLFISGDNFIKEYKDSIKKVVLNGCNVKILIADPVKSKDFLQRAEVICPQSNEEGSYVEQVLKTKSIIKSIQDEINSINVENKGSIEIRHYIDEYRYNIRIGIYAEEIDKYKYVAWANFQPMVKDSIDLSLTVIGKAENNKLVNSSNETEAKNMVLAMNKAFDELWKLYK